MRAVGVLAATISTVLGSLGSAPTADASNFGIELNGTYQMFSDGEWAKTNEVFIDEKSVSEIWTLSSSCETPIKCEGRVTSDKGWSDRLWLNYPNDYWVIDRTIPHWEPCPDGTFADGQQRFQLKGTDPVKNETGLKITDLLTGRQRTSGPSGACGINKPLVIEMPLRLVKIA